MHLSQFIPSSRSITAQNVQGLWETYLLPRGLPLLLGLASGLLLAILIVNEAWFLAAFVVLVVPVAVLLNRYPLVAVMIWLMLLPLFPHVSAYNYIYWVLHRSLIPLALGIVILSRMLNLKKYPPVRLGWIDLAMLSYLVVGAVSILLTRKGHIPFFYQFYDRVFVAFAAFWLMRFLSPQEEDLRRLLPVVWILCLAECAIGLLAWFVPEAVPSIWIFRQQGSRTTGTFGNPAVYSSTLMFLSLFLLHYAMNPNGSYHRGKVRAASNSSHHSTWHGKRKLTVLLLATFGLSIMCIFLSFSRGSWLAGALVLFALLFLYPRPILTLILILVPILVILSAGPLADEVAWAYERLNTEATAESRIVLAHAGRQMFLERPILGWGYGNYDLYDWKFIERIGNVAPSKWTIQKGTSHNTYLTILAEMGAVGLVLYIIPALWLLALTIKALPRLPKRGFWSRRLLFILWLSVGFHVVVSQFMDMRFFLFSVTLLWLTLGIIYSVVEPYLKQENIAG